ncbi:ImmA/IrrE family metallo-endopeptidase [Ligilactobacillus murinus]|uniref:ImmA/IrrE family metallo-endopeptidase n=1 Tax=Ligilactobacillus murinus TaxID=1622 RepID=UPI00129834A2|nr:ImmA/IrrE family metallo-endopeptidase [Ligilactobacillus murinus]
MYINQKIKDLLSELDISISYDPNLDDDGRYISEFNFIALNSAISEERQTIALLHELGHACEHHNCLDSFDRLLNGSKLERVANIFFFFYTVAQYLSTNDLEPEQANYVALLANIGLDDSYLPVIQMSLKRQYHA